MVSIHTAKEVPCKPPQNHAENHQTNTNTSRGSVTTIKTTGDFDGFPSFKRIKSKTDGFNRRTPKWGRPFFRGPPFWFHLKNQPNEEKTLKKHTLMALENPPNWERFHGNVEIPLGRQEVAR